MTEYIHNELEHNKQKNEALANQKIEEYKAINQRLEKKVKKRKIIELEFHSQVENFKKALDE